MRKVALVALEVAREAGQRRWLWVALALVTMAALLLGLAVDPAWLQRLFSAGGRAVSKSATQKLAVEVVLPPVILACSWLQFWGGLIFGLLTSADLAPELLAPGRIELTLALPLRRVEWVLGVYLGVLGLGLAGALYVGTLFTLVFAVKLGVVILAPLVAAAAAVLAFSAVYGSMLLASSHTRSSSVAAMVGVGMLVASMIAGSTQLAQALGQGLSGMLFRAFSAAIPRFGLLADLAPAAAGVRALPPAVWQAGLTALAWGALCVALCVRRMELRDF